MAPGEGSTRVFKLVTGVINPSESKLEVEAMGSKTPPSRSLALSTELSSESWFTLAMGVREWPPGSENPTLLRKDGPRWLGFVGLVCRSTEPKRSEEAEAEMVSCVEPAP